MSKVLFLSFPFYGHVNPLLGLSYELIKQGEEVIFICSEDFKDSIEKTGAVFRPFGQKSNCLKNSPKGVRSDLFSFAKKLLNSSEDIIEDILYQIKSTKIDYIVSDYMFPYGKFISQILRVPLISSFEMFSPPQELIPLTLPLVLLVKINPKLYKVVYRLNKTYDLKIKVAILSNLLFNKGDLNIVYTSKYFVSESKYYDNSFIFIGPPIYDRKENLNFPFDKLNNKKIIYISLGTVFNTDRKLYNLFFKTFGHTDAIVVMSAYKLPISTLKIPKNFIVKHYVPQSEILKYADVAITNGGMNSTHDLLSNNVPFVAIPLGADNSYMASRVSKLGAAISLNKNKLTPEILKTSVEKVQTDPSYINNIKKISKSFIDSGGYKKAVEEIFRCLKERKKN